MVEVITGGSGSGKSEYAEGRAVALHAEGKALVYIAAMKPFGEDAAYRIARHRAMRAEKGFTTVECYTDVETLAIEPGTTAILECMSNLLANEMFDQGGDSIGRIMRGIRTLAEKCGNLVIVTNEVFSDGVVYDSATQEYIQALAKLNRWLVDLADYACEVVYGIPVTIKGEPN